MGLHPIFSREQKLAPQARQLICAEAVAQIAHAANAKHNELMGESHILWPDLDLKTRRSIIDIVLKVASSNGCITPEELHIDWLKFKKEDGWTYDKGPVDRVRKTHPCLLEWKDLTPQQKLKDCLFHNIVITYTVMRTHPFQEI
jgi:hypothetical protein